jgi:hypothetical protein
MNRRRISWLWVGALLAIAGSAAAIDVRGIPQILRLAKLTITAAASTTGLTVNGPGTANTTATIAAGTTASNSFGALITAGTNSSDYALRVQNGAAASTYFQVDGAGAITAAAATSVPWTPKPIICTTACNASAIVVGQSAFITKTAATGRSATSFLADPDLQFTSLPTGTYDVSGDLYIYANNATNGGISAAFGYTGTITFAASSIVMNATTATAGGGNQCSIGTIQFSKTAVTLGAVSGDGIVFGGTCAITTGGVLELAWGQNTASNTTSVGASFVQITRTS